jgi:hypothetical protein
MHVQSSFQYRLFWPDLLWLFHSVSSYLMKASYVILGGAVCDNGVPSGSSCSCFPGLSYAVVENPDDFKAGQVQAARHVRRSALKLLIFQHFLESDAPMELRVFRAIVSASMGQ